MPDLFASVAHTQEQQHTPLSARLVAEADRWAKVAVRWGDASRANPTLKQREADLREAAAIVSAVEGE